MNHYIIDGNNLIGKIKHVKELQKKDKQGSRAELVKLLNKYFQRKKTILSLHLDGYPNEPLVISKGKIIYSKNLPSDNLIREEIDNSKNTRLIILITSDRNLMNYGKVCSCTVIKSEDFFQSIENNLVNDDEEQKIKQLEKERGEFEKLFGL
jgi:predicted RNA-binding protein with PIN domain